MDTFQQSMLHGLSLALSSQLLLEAVTINACHSGYIGLVNSSHGYHDDHDHQASRQKLQPATVHRGCSV